MVLIWGIKIGTMYKLLGGNDGGCCNQVVDLKTDEILSCVADSTMFWHQRLEHISEKGLFAMHSKGMVEGLPDCSSEFDLCEHCIYGKQNCVRFPSISTRAKGILELVHSDVFGPMSVPSLGVSWYYVSFIDDFSRMTWIYFLKKKLEVFERFLEFEALVENQIDRKIEVLRTDNGGELCGREFNQLCKEHGIARQNTTPYTPRQNGVFERMNKTLMEKARSMLSDAYLS